MAKCKNCTRSGWFLKIDRIGLCNNCSEKIGNALIFHSNLVVRNQDYINSSTKSTVSRLAKIHEVSASLAFLSEMWSKDIKGLSIDPSVLAIEHARIASLLIDGAILDAKFTARQRAQDATTDTTKISGYGRAIESLTKLMDLTRDVAPLELAIEDLRIERDGLRFDLMERKAEAAFAKGNMKKGIEILIDAILALRHDGTPDHLQVDRVERAEVKIRQCGGQPPARIGR